MRTLSLAALACGTASIIAACNSNSSAPTVEGSGGQSASSGGTSSSSTGGSTTTSNNQGGSTAAPSSTTSAVVSSGGQVSEGGQSASTSSSSTAPASGGATITSSSKPTTGGSSTANGGTAAATGGTKAASGGTSAAAGGKSGGGATTTSAVNGGSTAGGKSSSSATGGSTVVEAIGGSHSGEATFYTPNGNGNCSFGHAVDGKDIAALNHPDYGLATWCGACAEVTGPKGTITVLIQDQCPECKTGDLDLNPEAFDKIADHAAGRVKITWKFVPCDVTGPIQYHFKDGSSTGWVAVQILNHRLPIAKFEYSLDGTTWTNVERVDYNYFLRDSGFGPNIVRVRVTASTGATLTDTLPFATSDTVIDGEANF